MKNKKVFLISLFIFVGALLVSFVWSAIDYTVSDKNASFSYEVIQFDYDGASEGVDPNGDPFNAENFLDDQIVNDALQLSSLNNQYEASDIQKHLGIFNIVPENIVDDINAFESIIDSSNGREITPNDYHPVRYRFVLYQSLDNKLSKNKLSELLGNIVDRYCEKFYTKYKQSFNTSVYNELFSIESYDYIHQTAIFASKLNVLSNLASTIYNEHDDFKVADKTFNDIVLKANQLSSTDVSRINNIIILNALSKDLERLKDYYLYEIESLNYQKTKYTSDLSVVTSQLTAYKKDSTIYVGSGDNIVKVNSNSEETYNVLVEKQIRLSNSIASINVQISDFEAILNDINNASGSEDEYEIVKNYIAKLNDDSDSLEETFDSMLEAYNEKYIVGTSISKGNVRYSSNSIFSVSFVKRFIKIGAPIILISLLCICVLCLTNKLRKEFGDKAE